jgi:hypothetical protein
MKTMVIFLGSFATIATLTLDNVVQMIFLWAALFLTETIGKKSKNYTYKKKTKTKNSDGVENMGWLEINEGSTFISPFSSLCDS